MMMMLSTMYILLADADAVAADGAQQHHSGDLPAHGQTGGTAQVSVFEAGPYERDFVSSMQSLFGHVSRQNNDSIERQMVLGKGKGTRPRG